jgi:hypothetical protein
MPRKKSQVKADSELLRQLEAAGVSRTVVEAVCRLRASRSSRKILSPERTETLTRKLLSRVKGLVGTGARDFNVFRHLGSFVVSAEPRFVHELLKQPEIASAVANRQPESPVIPPSSPGKGLTAGDGERAAAPPWRRGRPR